MALSLTDDQAAIKAAAHEYLNDHASLDRLRSSIENESGWDEALWQGFATELGFTGVGIAEAHGGIGLGPIEQALMLEELGRTLAPIPWFESVVLAGGMIARAFQGDAQGALLGRIAGGEVATLAVRNAAGAAVPSALGASIVAGRLHGETHFVPFGHVASLLVVVARDELTGSISLAAIPSQRAGVKVKRVTALDLTRPFATIRFDAVEIASDECVPNAQEAFAAGWTAACGLLASEQVGGAARSLEETVAYAKNRVQFGRAIGSFQAVKHRLADMKLKLDSARSAADWAARTIAEGGDYAAVCFGARVYCTDAFLHCAADAIQLHGGIGFTWEHHAHLFFKRARSSAALLGAADEHRDAIARAIMDEVAA